MEITCAARLFDGQLVILATATRRIQVSMRAAYEGSYIFDIQKGLCMPMHGPPSHWYLDSISCALL